MALDLLRLLSTHGNSKTITTAIRTLSRAFHEDPLMHWLRCNNSNREFWLWLQLGLLMGRVYCTTNDIHAWMSQFPPESGNSEKTGYIPTRFLDAPGGIAILYPYLDPDPIPLPMIGRLLKLRLKVFIKDSLATRSSTRKRRNEMFHRAQENSYRLVQKRLRPGQKLWYLQTLAVDPSLQGRGVGKRIMQAIFQLIGHQPLILECSREANVGFYQSLGFEVIDTITLADAASKREECVTFWTMARFT
ncbi:hypothetical protein BDV28DRAFT_140902 [Aspergillus coremiiformis]|uniref:N-acetyltransferase domain-containing protein n=1 Tax=Aspergillus coremiiformis TaxID=138285 RepID=A0A5N6YW07_9EURO|nr:hypothetical protein BDV28DRAFT_140902 [Aspergillus coremiiformis]